MNKTKVRWGILGAANIARKNWKAIWNSGNGEVAAVASRDGHRAQQFINDCQTEAPFAAPPRALSSYEELVSAPDVDAVYCPLPTAVRKPWLLRAAKLGKHIICEKPCAPSLADLTEVLEACQRSRVQFSDGVMFMHSRRLQQLRDALNDPETFGRLRRITSAFTFGQSDEAFATNIRSQSELEPDGCLGDLGWYCIRFALWTMDWRLPERVSGRILAQATNRVSRRPVPTDFSGELFFSGGVSSTFYCSFLTQIEQWAVLSGDRGHIRIDDFVLPFLGDKISFSTSSPLFTAKGCDFAIEPRWHHPTVPEHSHSHQTAQETNLFRAFAARVLSGELEPSWADAARKTQLVMDACRESALENGRLISLS